MKLASINPEITMKKRLWILIEIISDYLYLVSKQLMIILQI